jgi:hypothetical protein
VAAMVLVVAVGTLVVFRNGVGPVRVDSTPAPVGPDTSIQAEGVRTMAEAGSPIAFEAQPAQKTPTRTESIAPVSTKRGGAAGRVTASENVATSENTRDAAPAAPAFAQSLVIGAAAMDAANEPPLKVVAIPRTIGARVTLYEVTPGDTVTLTEPTSLPLSAVVTTGAAAESQQRQSVEKSAAAAPARRADAAAASTSAANSQAAAKAVAAPESVEVVNGVTTIRWTDRVTGNVLSLSGRMPAARLQEIKLRIERERAAEAAKKNP